MELRRLQIFDSDSSPWRVPAEVFDMVVDGQSVGSISLRMSDAPYLILYSGHVGYSVKETRRGHGYAGQACRLIAEIARSKGMEALWITCHPDNGASIATIEKLGAVYVETVDLPKDHHAYGRGERQKRRYRLNLY